MTPQAAAERAARDQHPRRPCILGRTSGRSAGVAGDRSGGTPGAVVADPACPGAQGGAGGRLCAAVGTGRCPAGPRADRPRGCPSGGGPGDGDAGPVSVGGGDPVGSRRTPAHRAHELARPSYVARGPAADRTQSGGGGTVTQAAVDMEIDGPARALRDLDTLTGTARFQPAWALRAEALSRLGLTAAPMRPAQRPLVWPKTPACVHGWRGGWRRRRGPDAQPGPPGAPAMRAGTGQRPCFHAQSLCIGVIPLLAPV
jgi:hypothetical protein